MTYYNTDNWPTLRDAIKELIDIKELVGIKVERYGQFTAKDKPTIIAALIKDTPARDQGDLFFNTEDTFSLLENLSLFIESKKFENELRQSFIKTIEAGHIDFLIGFTDQVIREIESDAREYAAEFHNRLSILVEGEMGLH